MPAVYSKISDADKRRIYDSYLRGDDYLETALLLGIKRTTAYNIVKRANENDGQVAIPRGGRRRNKVSDEMRREVLDIVELHPDFTTQRINAELRVRLPHAPEVSRTALSNILDGLLISKKLEDAPAERNSERTKEQRHQFATWLMHHVHGTEFIYIDEAGINLWMKRTRGRAVRGTRAVRVVQGRRGTNFTMTFAVSNISGLVHHELSEGGMTGERFVHFLQTVYTNHRANAVVFIVDNAAAHRPAANVQLPDDCGLCFLPPYSPFLNICENAFAIWKAEIKTTLADVRQELLTQPHQQRMATLAQLAEQGINVVTAQKMQAAFRGGGGGGAKIPP